MAEIAAKLVSDLREKTGAGFMDCKKALAVSAGDLDKAVDYLREKGLASAKNRASRVAAEGAVGSYIHMGGRIGVLVEVNCETDFVAKGEDFQDLVKDIAMQIAAAAPKYVRREEIPAAEINREQAIYKKQVIEAGKPENVAVKIVEGKLEKFFQEICLIDQPFVKEPSKNVTARVSEVAAKTGENIQVRRFVRFQLGEGIEKRKENLAAEIAKMTSA